MSDKKKVPLDHLRSLKKPIVRTVRIATDQEVAERYQRAFSDHLLAKSAWEKAPRSEVTQKTLQESRAKLDEVEAELRENSMLFKFRSLGRRKYDDLVKAHPITDEQREEAIKQNNGEDPGIEWNLETFPDALISECLIEPEITPGEMLDWLQSDDWNSAEVQSLFQAAFEANTVRSVVELGKD